MTKKPVCLDCGKKPARKGSSFCTDRCGSKWADCFLEAGSHWWCEVCGEWHGDHGVGICPAEVEEQ